VTVNAIAIEESEPDLTAYFFENVIFGEGAFVVSASGFADYPERIRKKLLREVTQQSAGFR
jgi:Ca-activated chloride channel family protein